MIVRCTNALAYFFCLLNDKQKIFITLPPDRLLFLCARGHVLPDEHAGSRRHRQPQVAVVPLVTNVQPDDHGRGSPAPDPPGDVPPCGNVPLQSKARVSAPHAPGPAPARVRAAPQAGQIFSDLNGGREFQPDLIKGVTDVTVVTVTPINVWRHSAPSQG